MDFDVEREFDAVVRDMGGIRVSDLIGGSPTFDNADYVFHREGLVAEFKCLEEDRRGDPRTAQKLRRLWIKWRQRGLVSGPVPSTIESRQLPDVCTKEMYRVMGKSVRRRIQKANKQVRETKHALGLESYHGLLLLGNSGNLALPPAGLLYFVFDVLQRDFRELRSFILFTVMLPSFMPGLPRPTLFWFSGNLDDDPHVSEAFSRDLHQRWAQRLEELTGIPMDTADLDDSAMGAFWHSQYLD